ncbi:Elicitor-responsive protein, partial [Thalictrum thalictroides]
KIEPYVVVHYGNQERKSRVARGSNPTWNESFMFKVECPKGAKDQHKITFRIMDKDTFSADDFLGESIIYVKDVVSLGVEKGTAKLPPTKHRVVLENQKYYGEIQVGVAFISKRNEEQRKRCNLEDEVIELQADLEKEHKVNRVLQCALHEPNNSRPRVSSWLPIQVQMLLAEVTIVEHEILCLERKFEELKICLYQEKKQTKEWRLFQQQQHQQKLQMHHICRSANRRKRRNRPSPLGQSFNSADFRSQRWSTERKTSLGSASDITTISSQFNDVERNSNDQSRKQGITSHIPSIEDPNRLSEDLINSLIGIFLKLNRPQAELNCEVSSTVPKLGLSCINSKGIVSKTSFNCKLSSNNYKTFLDPYGILPDIDGPVREVGPYKNFMQFTRSSLDMNRLPECLPTIGKL